MSQEKVVSEVTASKPAVRIFDRRHLIAGEKVVWEGRPSFWIVLLRPIVMAVLALIYASILLSANGSFVAFVAAVVVSALMIPLNRRYGILAAIAGVLVAVIVAFGGGSFLPFVLIPIILGVIPFVLTFLQWRHTSLAVTDRRIVSQYGLANLAYADTGFDKVQTIKVSQPWYEKLLGFGDIMILTAGDTGEARERRTVPGIKLLQGGGIVWLDVEKPFEVERMLGSMVYRPQRVEEARPVAQSVGAEEKIDELKRMKDKGQLTEDEYEEKRVEIIKRV